jgi:hypothetical protein
MYKIFVSIIALILIFSCEKKKETQEIDKKDLIVYQTVPDISAEDIRSHLDFLASDTFEGRKAGSVGEKMAAEYIKDKFTALALKEYQKGYYNPFSFWERNHLYICKLRFDDFEGSFGKDFVPLIMLDSFDVSTDVVCIGYGYQYTKYNDYKNINVKGKWVIIFEGNSSDLIVPISNQRLSERYSIAQKNGALGILAIHIDKASNGLLVPQTFSSSSSLTDTVPMFRISQKVADSIFKYARTSTLEVLDKLKSNKEEYRFHIPVQVSTSVHTKQDSMQSNNVVAYMEGKDSVLRNEYIVIGAHYDHLGKRITDGMHGDSIIIYNGADDNASGVAGLLEIAEKLTANNNLKRSIIFMAFGAEEEGLKGSRFICENLPVPPENIKFMINLDMIGRLDSCNLYVNTVRENTPVERVLKNLSRSYPEIKLNFAPSKKQNTDHYPFYAKNIPVASFTTGYHPQYHTPNDTIGTINCSGEKYLLDLVYDLVVFESEK